VTSANSLKYNEFLEVAGIRNNWDIVVESGEEDIVIKRVIAGFFPFLPSTGILSSSNEDHVSDLDEDSYGFEVFDLARVVQVDQYDLGSIEVDAVH
jgi:hypothetical protein